MSNENIKKCSKCNINHWDLGNQVNYSGISDCGHQRIFKKNGKYFCFNCLTSEYPVKCHLCHKRINRKDELGKWAGNTFHLGDCSSDPDYFGFRCWDCSEERHNPGQSSYNEYKPNPGGDNVKNCRITGCPYKVSPYFEKLGVCGVHAKKCQGTVFTHWNGGYKAKHGTTQFLPCTNAVASEGDFCEHCKDQTETYQQVKERIAAEEKQGFKKYKRFQTQAQSWWDTLSSFEREKECERLVENMKQGKYWANNVKEGESSGWTWDGSWWSIENGKFVSSSPYLVPIQITEEFMQKELSSEEVSLVMRKKDDGDVMIKLDNNDDKTNFLFPNPAVSAPQSINTPKPNPGSENRSPEIKITVKAEDNATSYSNSSDTPKQTDKKFLVINLKEIKKITLRNDGNLVIEFNNLESEKYSTSQVISSEQIVNDSELQKVKDYCQQNNKSSLSQDELTNLFQTNKNNSLFSSKPQNHQTLWISLGIGGTLIVGIIAGLLLRSKGDKISKK